MISLRAMAHTNRLSTADKCKECGWQCQSCTDQTNLHLHVEIENLKQRLLEREHHIVSMETNFLNEAEKFPNGEFSALTEELLTWQEKYSRLYESHKRVQKVNQSLEDKLLRIVDKCETEKSTLSQDLGNLTQRLVEAKSKVKQLEDENERYRNDVNLAIQLLQCKPTNFVSQKLDTMSPDLQLKVRTYISNKRTDGNGSNTGTPKPEPKIIKVPIPTFPPTAMVYSLNTSDKDETWDGKTGSYKQPVDIVSAAIMAKVLEERARERLYTKHCETCTCSTPQQNADSATQTGACQTDSVTFTNIANSSNRGSQGLVRYIDVVTTRSKSDSFQSSQSVERNSEARFLNKSKTCESPVMSHSGTKNVKYIAARTARTSSHTDAVPNVRSIDSMKLTDPRLTVEVEDCYKSRYTEPKQIQVLHNCNVTDSEMVSDAINSPLSSFKLGEASKSLLGKSSMQAQDDVLWTNLSSSSGSPASSQVSIDMENVVSEQPSGFSSVPKSREVLFGSINENKRLQSYLDKSEPIRARNEEGRTFLSDKINMKSMEVTKMTNPNKTLSNKVDLPGERRSKTIGRRVGSQVTELAGPRACSLRIQAGTSNILLANATCYTPVLYTSRSDVMVHAPRSRSTSASSNET